MDGYGIGIDTGGTFTDAAVMNLATGDVVATGKTRTTHYDLSQCIRTAINTALNADGVIRDQVRLVAFSTTLATNTVVESRN